MCNLVLYNAKIDDYRKDLIVDEQAYSWQLLYFYRAVIPPTSECWYLLLTGFTIFFSMWTCSNLHFQSYSLNIYLQNLPRSLNWQKKVKNKQTWVIQWLQFYIAWTLQTTLQAQCYILYLICSVQKASTQSFFPFELLLSW